MKKNTSILYLSCIYNSLDLNEEYEYRIIKQPDEIYKMDLLNTFNNLLV